MLAGALSVIDSDANQHTHIVPTAQTKCFLLLIVAASVIKSKVLRRDVRGRVRCLGPKEFAVDKVWKPDIWDQHAEEHAIINIVRFNAYPMVLLRNEALALHGFCFLVN